VAVHLGNCAECASIEREFRRVSQQVAAMGRIYAPGKLATDVRTLLARADAETPRVRPLLANRWAQVAALLLACAFTASAVLLLMPQTPNVTLLEREVADAHMRSLLHESPFQVASSDTHTIKPWFAGRLDFSPEVKDLTVEGFPLSGARLDFIAGRRVAALVYHRRMHVVNVFVWPSAGGGSSSPNEFSHQGYNVVTWNKAGTTYWAVSDLNMAELRHLESLL